MARSWSCPTARAATDTFRIVPTTQRADILSLFEACLDRPEAERDAWLAAQPAPEPIRAGVRRLLDAERRIDDFLEAPVVDQAHAPPLLPAAGERIGPYELLRALDAGGMGVVYLARRADAAYEQQVAIKLVQPLYLAADGALRERMIARFEEERAILAQLSHPGIARILDGGTTVSGIPYLVMEYVDGAALTAYCDTQALDVDARVRLFRKVCEAVQAAHRHLIVHRDLKPENVLVGRDGEPRLLDFGIAKLLGRASDAAADRATSLVAMTPAYASPEQIRQQPLTTASDIYSLGVMLHQLLTGMRPYELAGLSPVEAERLVCSTVPEPLRRALRSAPMDEALRQRRIAAIGTDLERIVAKAMHKDPERRYGSAQAFSEDLQRYLDGHPVHAQADTAMYRIGKFLRRHRLATAAAGLALAAILGAAALAVFQAQRAERAAADTAEINRFLVDVLDASDAYTSGSELTLNEALGDAADKVEQRFAGRPDLAAGVRLALGNSLANHGRLDAADVLLQRALADSSAAFGDDDIRTLEAREAIALLHSQQGHHEDAIAELGALITQLNSGANRSHPLLATAVSDLAYVHLYREDYAAALPNAERAVALFETQGVDVAASDRASMLANLAHALDGVGRSAEAAAPYARARDILQGLFPDGSPNTAILLNNWGLLERTLGNHERALELLRESSDMRRRLFRGPHPLLVRGMSNVARQALALDRTDIALQYAQDAVAVADAVYVAPHDDQVLALVALAETLGRAGRIDEALAALARAHAVLEGIDEPLGSAVDYYERVRAALCEDGSASRECPHIVGAAG